MNFSIKKLKSRNKKQQLGLEIVSLLCRCMISFCCKHKIKIFVLLFDDKFRICQACVCVSFCYRKDNLSEFLILGRGLICNFKIIDFSIFKMLIGRCWNDWMFSNLIYFRDNGFWFLIKFLGQMNWFIVKPLA